jgi:predicted RNase H-like HicB family nuclease
MFTEFIEKKLKIAQYKLLKDGSYFGEIPGLKGVWANAKTLEDCRAELEEVLEDWLILKLKSGESIAGLRFHFDKRSLLKHA